LTAFSWKSGWKPDPAAAEKLDVNEDESSNSLDCLLMEVWRVS
jgi:hypothetical protein